MSKNIELEYKTLLTKEQFETIKKNYHFNEPFKQVNHYYDVPEKTLSKRRCPLRIREIDNKLVFTLKTPNKIGVNEYEMEVSSFDFKDITLSNDIIKALGDVNYKELVEFGSLTTYRSELITDLAVISLDENFYADQHDYEIEYEVKKDHDSLQMFKAFMYANGIANPKPAPGKTSRFRKATHFLDR